MASKYQFRISFDSLKSLMHGLHLDVKLTKCSTSLYLSAAERSSSIIGRTVEELDGIRKAKGQLPADSLIDQVQMFDPMNNCSDTTITEFEDWYTDRDSTYSKIKVQLIHEEVIEHSFLEAFMPGVWLGNDHMDYLVQLLKMKAQENPKQFASASD